MSTFAELDSFLKSTEETTSGITPAVNKTLEYPILFITNLVNVEITYLADRNILAKTKISENHLPLYLHIEGGGYRLLGYLQLNFSSIIQMNYLHHHEIYLKASKDKVIPISSIMDQLLLTV